MEMFMLETPRNQDEDKKWRFDVKSKFEVIRTRVGCNIKSRSSLKISQIGDTTCTCQPPKHAQLFHILREGPTMMKFFGSRKNIARNPTSQTCFLRIKSFYNRR